MRDGSSCGCARTPDRGGARRRPAERAGAVTRRCRIPAQGLRHLSLDGPVVALARGALAVPRADQRLRPRHRRRRRRRRLVAPHLRRLRDERGLGVGRPRRDVARDLRERSEHQHRRHRGREIESRHRLGRDWRGEPVPRVDARRRASSSRPTAAARSRTPASPTHRRSPASSSIRPTRTLSMSPRRDMPGPKTRPAACS